MRVDIPVSVGELIDKISILQIKSKYTDNEYVRKELNHLIEIATNHNVFNYGDLQNLLDVNEKLWNIEDKLRDLEKEQRFDQDFIELARSVYITNDKRARIKKDINEKFNSEYKEIKLY
jgi:predicted  nucleic acid-binding Zn-ribbon protein